MSLYVWVFVAMCAAVLIPWAICGMFGAVKAVHAREDATYPRTAGMGDPSTVDPAVWHPRDGQAWSDTPVFDQLAAEVAANAARYIETEWWLENGGEAS